MRYNSAIMSERIPLSEVAFLNYVNVPIGSRDSRGRFLPRGIARIIQLLKSDQIGVMPTDTVYGVHGLALDQKIVERIYQLKGRPKEKPFMVLTFSLFIYNRRAQIR